MTKKRQRKPKFRRGQVLAYLGDWSKTKGYQVTEYGPVVSVRQDSDCGKPGDRWSAILKSGTSNHHSWFRRLNATELGRQAKK